VCIQPGHCGSAPQGRASARSTGGSAPPSIARAILQIATTVVVLNVILPGLGFAAGSLGLAAAAAAGAAAIATGLSGGNLGQILSSAVIAAATAAAFFEVGSFTNAIAGIDPSAVHIQPAFGTPEYAFNVASHALVGCAASAASGGSCESGALSGGVTAAAGPWINGQRFGVALVENAVLGGAASVAGGGKFANGVITGTFGYLFNELGGCLQRGYCFATRDDAAKAALSLANPRSIDENTEYGGLLYQQQRDYAYTGPIRGSGDTVNPADAPAPDDAGVVGNYHTHGDYSMYDAATQQAIRTGDLSMDTFDSDNFSPGDKFSARSDSLFYPGFRAYLGTPSGQFKFFDPRTGETGVLR
jgi:hypothetical protein